MESTSKLSIGDIEVAFDEGLKEKAKEFKDHGSEIYSKA